MVERLKFVCLADDCYFLFDRYSCSFLATDDFSSLEFCQCLKLQLWLPDLGGFLLLNVAICLYPFNMTHLCELID